jgi:hypothetical protein
MRRWSMSLLPLSTLIAGGSHKTDTDILSEYLKGHNSVVIGRAA